MSVRRRVTPLFATVLLAAGACGGDEPSTRPANDAATTSSVSPSTRAAPTPAALREARDQAVAWIAGELERIDPLTLVLVDYLHRRFDLAELSSARALARTGAAADTEASNPELRLIRPDARVRPESLREPGAYGPSMLVRGALACDEPGSPPEMEQWLREGVAAGGYDLTHAAVALGIEVDLGCTPTGDAALRAEIVDRIADAAQADTDLGDLAVERLAMLEYMGASARIPAERLAALVTGQQADGSWAGPDAGMQRHTVALALWVLAGAVERAEGRRPTAAPLVLTR